MPLLNSPTTTSKNSEVNCSAAVSPARLLIVGRGRVGLKNRDQAFQRSQFRGQQFVLTLAKDGAGAGWLASLLPE